MRYIVPQQLATQVLEGGSSERFAFVDVAKGLAIAFVVLGHTIRGLLAAGLLPDGPFVRGVDGFLYTFHVQLFFLVSGMLIMRVAEREPLGAYTRGRIARLGWPYLVWAPTQYVVQALAPSNHPQPLADVWRVVYDPPLQFWFLAALLLQLLFFGVAFWAGARRVGFLVVCMIVYVAFPHVPLGWGVLYRVCEHLPYLGVGVLLGEPRLLGRIRDLAPLPAAALALGGFGLITAAVVLGVSGERAYVLALGLAGCAALLALSALLVRTYFEPGLLLLGARSLEIFVAHTMATAGTRIVFQRVVGLDDPGLHLVLGVAAGLAAPLVLHAIAVRIGWRWVFEWPGRKRDATQPSPGSSRSMNHVRARL